VVLHPLIYQEKLPRRDSWTIVRAKAPLNQGQVVRAVLPADLARRKSYLDREYYTFAGFSALPPPPAAAGAQPPKKKAQPAGRQETPPRSVAVHFPNAYTVAIGDEPSI